MTMTAEIADDKFVEFRCTKCYQLRHEPVQNMGTEASCPFCTQEQSVPVVGDDELIDADRVVATMSHVNVQSGQFSEKPLSREEIDEVAKSRAEARNADANSGRGIRLHAEPLTRACAAFIDFCVAAVVMLLSYGVGCLTQSVGLCPPIDSEYGGAGLVFCICYFGIVVIYYLLYWGLIAKTGQSPGKMLMGIKIVDSIGNPPGFIHGVLLRYIIAGFAFAIIPMGHLADSLWIFNGTPPRCLHDHLAGTDVVYA